VQKACCEGARARVAWLVMICACQVYDPQLSTDLSPQRTAPDAAVDGAADEAPDTGQSVADEPCHWNPDPARVECPLVCPEFCNGVDDDCDGRVDEGQPGALCSLPHADAVCREGECFLIKCLDDFRDCDQSADTGCEIAQNDPYHCGGCDNACEIPHATAQCVEGDCRVEGCAPGFADCDDDGRSCETSTETLSDCGACGRACPELPHAVVACERDACGIDHCQAGFADCDGELENGCEQRLDTLAHCGACDRRCAKASCGGGTCTAVDCSDQPGRADCDRDEKSCEVDLSSDLGHCGGCDSFCRFAAEIDPHAQLACEAGECRAGCEEGWGDCNGDYADGCEQRLNTLSNCGACRQACEVASAAGSCESGRCLIERCEGERADCDGDGRSCETELDSPLACGACGAVCDLEHANQICGGSPGARACALASCESGFADCDGLLENGCERDTRAPGAGGAGPCSPETNCSKASLAGHDYYFCPTPRGWGDARSRCQLQRGGDLAHLESSAERDFVASRLSSRNWIGHSDASREGLWIWAYNGVPFWRGASTGSRIAGRFADWAAGEPNGSGDCGAIFQNGGLDDLDCGLTQPFVCEVTPDECPDDLRKVDPGQCGCGRTDSDVTGDGIADCLD
jgi:hypothetical protein